ncbi:MAG: hypothetical protein BMS9Abin13_600 [Patescibacteria group bacterium]|nr:MAG: hypothetical protein BMS9Abin13_600 [Patescibacteria group bacterium]
MVLRIFLDLAIIFSILYLNWWIAALFAIGGILIFRNFYEAVALGLLIDILYGAPAAEFFGFRFVSTAIFAILFVGVSRLRENIRIKL